MALPPSIPPGPLAPAMPQAPSRWASPPLAWQILGLLLVAMVVAQLVTLLMTLLLPPAPPRQYELRDIAQVLAGADGAREATLQLQRNLQAEPPQRSGPGWLTPEQSRLELAQMLGRPPESVRLYFYTPLPFTGLAGMPPAPGQPPPAPPPRPGQHSNWRPPTGGDALQNPVFLRVQAAPGGGGGGAGPRGPAGGIGSAGGSRAERAERAEQGMGAERNGAGPRSAAPAPGPVGAPAGTPSPSPGPAPAAGPTSNSPPIGPPAAASLVASPDNTRAANIPPAPGGAPPADAAPPAPSRPLADRPMAGTAAAPTGAPAERAGAAVASDAGQASIPPAVRMDTYPPITSPSTPPTTSQVPASTAPPPATDAQQHPAPPASTATDATPTTQPASPYTLPPAPPAEAIAQPMPAAPTGGLFEWRPEPFVHGDFVAAVYMADMGWATVQPAAEAFPNAWQRRVLLWFAVALALVAPLAWWFARRLVRPLGGFADAAERLGRNPAAPVLALEGPAEVGRAARAFNRMQSRLRSFVEDRTAMVGAISHDLRTPLTRMRFRVEDLPDDADAARQGLLRDMDEMEQMIRSVLHYLGEAGQAGPRETLDLASLVQDVVDDSTFVGHPVSLTDSRPALVEVDAIALRRVLSNLVENAVKYGGVATLRLRTTAGEAVVEVQDAGPGIDAAELEQVFQPFYRTRAAQGTATPGYGLGLAVCRSIARAHGGDVRLRNTLGQGLVAELHLPLVAGAAGAPQTAHQVDTA